MTQGKAEAEHAVVQFHEQFNAEQYHEIYAQADDAFHKASKEPDVIAMFEAVHRKLGTVKQAKETGWRVGVTPMGTVVNVAYDTEFSDGSGVEQFGFLVKGGKAVLLQYNINSPLLVIR